ncbi:hypothetical protein ABIF50_010055, partial [Bradyrhizobium diazoefficiens]
MARPPAAAGRTAGGSRNAAARWQDRATGRAEQSVRRAAGAIADHLPIRAHDRTGPPFRQAHDGLQMRDRSALGGGPYHFFERSSRRAAASSICSARSFFSFAFSSSRALSRFASETSMPPNLAFPARPSSTAIGRSQNLYGPARHHRLHRGLLQPNPGSIPHRIYHRGVEMEEDQFGASVCAQRSDI